MQIKIENTVLAGTDLGAGCVGPTGLALNGRQLVDEGDFIGAATATFFARGNASVQLQFGATREFGSVRAAEAFALMHASSIPLAGIVQVVAGVGADVQLLGLRDAVVESVQIVRQRGRSVEVRYSIVGAKFESDIPPEEIPGEAEPGEEVVVMRRGKVAIASGAASVAVVFSAPLESVPATVLASVSRPAGSPALGCSVREDSITVAGFTADLDAATPDANYRLHFTAIE